MMGLKVLIRKGGNRLGGAHMPVTPVFRRLKQKDGQEFQANLGHTSKTCLGKKKKKKEKKEISSLRRSLYINTHIQI